MTEVMDMVNRGFALGLDLGRSVEALENKPTLAQARFARTRLEVEFPDLTSLDNWWGVVEGAFERGYAQGKTDPEGARARVKIKRAEARATQGSNR